MAATGQEKRPLGEDSSAPASESTGEAPTKRARNGNAEGNGATPPREGIPDEFDKLIGGAGDPLPGNDEFEALIGSSVPSAEPGLDRGNDSVPAEEIVRRQFAEKLESLGAIGEEELPGILTTIREEVAKWSPPARWRTTALVLAYLARSSRLTRNAFVAADGMPLLGGVLQDGVAHLESSGASERQEAGMRVMACLLCLRALPIGRATMWEHRMTVGKAFDKLHRWCGKEKSALAAELRAPTTALCRRWRGQPKPAQQEASQEQRALRKKVVDILLQGLAGVDNSPASPAVPQPSPGRLPISSSAAELEAALFGHHGGATAEYRQHARMLRSNLALAGNAGLRARVLEGEISAQELVALDSSHLAPELLQEQRRKAERKVLAQSVVEKLKPIRMDSNDRLAYNAGTAPPLSPAPNDKEDSPKNSTTDNKPTPVMMPMEPPPTPFRDGLADGGHVNFHRQGLGEDAPLPPPTPDVMATPAPEEDSEEAEVIRWLSRPM